MVTIPERKPDHYTTVGGVEKSVDMITAYGLSTDEKPTNLIANGSMFIEEDTRKVYLFDEENGVWRHFAGGEA